MSPIELFSPFLPATYSVPKDRDEDRLDTYLVDKLSQFADVVNDKVIGAFTQTVTNYSGKKFIYDTTSIVRTGFQYLIRIPSYPNSGTLTITTLPPINAQFAVFQVWGSANLPPTTPGTGDYFSFYGSGNSRISFTFSDTQIVITTTGLGSGYSGFICIDYVADGS